MTTLSSLLEQKAMKFLKTNTVIAKRKLNDSKIGCLFHQIYILKMKIKMKIVKIITFLIIKMSIQRLLI